MKHSIKNKLESFYNKNQGLIVKYKHQEFQVCYDSKSYIGGGLYCKAISNGRVLKGDAQFIEWRVLRKFA